MSESNWADTFPAAITVSDRDGNIIYLNEASAKVFEKDGGKALLGKNLIPCHSKASNELMEKMLSEGSSNIYTIQKKGKKKMIMQAPYFVEGEVAGLVEISFELPEVVAHHNRD